MEYRKIVKAGQVDVGSLQKMVRSLERRWKQPVVAYITGRVIMLNSFDDDVDVKETTLSDPIEILEFIPPSDDEKGMLLVATDCWWPDNDPYSPATVVGWCVIPTENTVYELCSAFIMPSGGLPSVLGVPESQRIWLSEIDSQGNRIVKNQ